MVIKPQETREKNIENVEEELNRLEKIIDGALAKGKNLIYLKDYTLTDDKKRNENEYQILMKIKEKYVGVGWRVHLDIQTDGRSPARYFLEFY